MRTITSLTESGVGQRVRPCACRTRSPGSSSAQCRQAHRQPSCRPYWRLVLPQLHQAGPHPSKHPLRGPATAIPDRSACWPQESHDRARERSQRDRRPVTLPAAALGCATQAVPECRPLHQCAESARDSTLNWRRPESACGESAGRMWVMLPALPSWL